MTSELRSILDELFAALVASEGRELDPSLRAQEEELVPILEKLLKRKPAVEPDPAFVQKLRVLLRDKAMAPRTSSSFFSFFTMHALNYAVTGAVLGAIITGPVVYGIMQSNGLPAFPQEGSRDQALFSYSVEETGNRAFGDLSTINTAGQGGGGMDAYNPRPQSGGGGATAESTMLANPDMDQKMLIAPEMVEYNLKFDGELPALTNEQVEILKRQKGVSSADMSKIMSAFNTGLADLNSFDGAKTDTLSFYQDKAYGYLVNVSFREGMISISQNWEKWPQPGAECRDEACYRRIQLKMSDIPADETLISIADAFVREHGIDLSQYGPAEVDTMWKQSYGLAADQTQIYVPDQIRVIYPQLVEGQHMYDEGGGKVGLSVGVNIREKKVSDVWGIMDQKYLKSSYPGVTDAAQITAFLENYGKVPPEWITGETKLKTVDITLGTPEIGYMKMYTYESNVSEELIVPALIFPVTNVPAGEYYYRTTIAVPLAADMLNKMSQQIDPRPMPLIMEDNVRTDGAVVEE